MISRSSDHIRQVWHPRVIPWAIPVLALLASACGDPAPAPASWFVVHENLPGALMSVWGTDVDDVWTVGADVGDGPTVMHFDGTDWQSMDPGVSGNLWWVHGFADGPVYMGGASGQIVRYQDGAFTAMTTPGTGVVFGIWGASPDDMWAVGGAAGGGSGGFAWRLVGEEWVPADGFPAGIVDSYAVWKIHGRSADDVWMVGTNGLGVHWDGQAFTQENLPTGESVFTVHSNSERFVAVGGFGTGTVFENDGSGWVDVSPQGREPLIGVHVGEEHGFAVGQFAFVMERVADQWQDMSTLLPVFESLHAVWMDPAGGVWAVGGQVQSSPLVRGVMLYRGQSIPGETES